MLLWFEGIACLFRVDSALFSEGTRIQMKRRNRKLLGLQKAVLRFSLYDGVIDAAPGMTNSLGYPLTPKPDPDLYLFGQHLAAHRGGRQSWRAQQKSRHLTSGDQAPAQKPALANARHAAN